MKKVGITLFLIFFVFGMMPFIFAQSNADAAPSSSGGGEGYAVSNVKPVKLVKVSPTEVTQISTPIQTVSECLISDESMKEYSQLIIELGKVEFDDKGKAEEIISKIAVLKQEIARNREKCKPRVASYVQTTAIKPTEVPAIATKPVAMNRCKEIEGLEFKYAHYKEIYSLSDEEIKKKGYLNREEIKKTLKHLSDSIIKIKIECGKEVWTPVIDKVSIICPDGSSTKCQKKIIEKCGVNTFSVFNQCGEGMFRNVYVECYDGFELKDSGQNLCQSSLDWQSFAKKSCEGHCKKIETSICSTCPQQEHEIKIGSIKISDIKPITLEKPVIANSAEEIKKYYKTKIEKITSKNNIDEEIKNLKLLRVEIDNLIEELIKGKNVITISDVGNLVTKINIGPGEIKADNVNIKTVGKKILADLNNKAVSIEPREKEVIIKEEDIEVKAKEISIEDNVLKVDGVQVKLAPSDVLNKLKIKPNSVELKNEDGKVVYKIKTYERKNLLGFIPIKIKKILTVDGGNGDLLQERSSWYSFLTTS